MQIDPNKVQWDEGPAIDTASVVWDASPAPGKKQDRPGIPESFGMGVLRGAKDVVDTGAGWLASGFDKIAGTNEGERVRQLNEAGKADFDQRYGDSTAADVGRFTGNVAATLPVGGVLGKGVQAVGNVFGAGAKVAPLAQSITSGGMSAGGLKGAAGLATRAAGGAVAGGAMTGLVDPESAASGAVIGAALPGVVQGAGKAMHAIGSAVRGPAVPEAIRKAASLAQESGYVIPPTQVKPSLFNRVVEGTAGKASTAQNASARNQVVTNNMAKKALGLADDAALDSAALQTLRKKAGGAYQDLRKLGMVQADDAFVKDLATLEAKYKGASTAFPDLADDSVGSLVRKLNVQKFDADGAVDALAILRDQADSAFVRGDKGVGQATKGAASALEDLLERHATQSGNPQALKSLRDARQLIAKTYSVEKAMNPATGTVSAQKLAQQFQRGKPLSGELRRIAEFGAAFPKAAQATEAMGSLPQISPLDWALAGGVSAATANPLGAGMMLVRPGARATALSGPVQRGLLASPSASAAPSAIRDGLLGYGYRAAPLLSTSQ